MSHTELKSEHDLLARAEYIPQESSLGQMTERREQNIKECVHHYTLFFFSLHLLGHGKAKKVLEHTYNSEPKFWLISGGLLPPHHPMSLFFGS